MLLYSMFETSRNMFFHPLEKSAKLMEPIFSTPSPLGFIQGAKETKALLNLTGRVNQDYDKPEWKIDTTTVDNSEFQIEITEVVKNTFCNLLHFKKVGFKENLPTLLIVAPLSGHYPTLLRDTVKNLLPTHDIFITEWINVKNIPVYFGDFSLDDYVRYVIQFLQYLHQDGRLVHMLSICQPTVPSLVAQSLMAQRNDPAQARSMIMVGGPIDARKSPTSVNNFGTKYDIDWFERNVISMVPYPYKGMGRMVYPGFLQHFGFVSMNPTRHLEAHKKYFEDLTKGDDSSVNKHREFYDEYNAVMDLPKTYYLQTIKKVFQDFDLPKGNMVIDNQKVEPSAIKNCALLTIEGELDDISGAGQTHSAHDLCSSISNESRVQKTFEGVGHYGIFSGSKFKNEIVPFISKFTQENNS